MITANNQLRLKVNTIKALAYFLIHLFMFIYLFVCTFSILNTEEPKFFVFGYRQFSRSRGCQTAMNQLIIAPALTLKFS
jgi:hypothetical protein